MKIEFEITPEVYAEFKLHQAINSGTIKQLIVFEKVMGAVIFALIGVALVNGGYINTMVAVIFVILASIVWSYVFPEILAKFFRFRLRRRFKSKRFDGSGIFGKKEIELSDKKMVFRSIKENEKSEKVVVIRDKVRSLHSNEKILFLFTTNNTAFFIPRAAFPNEEGIELFMSLKPTMVIPEKKREGSLKQLFNWYAAPFKKKDKKNTEEK